MFSSVTVFLLVIICNSVYTAPAREIVYNQMQNGTNNLFADVENVLILIVPSNRMASAAASILNIDLRKSLTPAALRYNLPQEDTGTNIIISQDDTYTDTIKLPEPPEPAQSELKSSEEKQTQKESSISEDQPAKITKSKQQTEQKQSETIVDDAKQSGTHSRSPEVSAKLLAFGLGPAVE